jgi:folate-binding protein YgfZ
MSEAATLPVEVIPAPTPLAAHLHPDFSNIPLRTHAGAVTPEVFSSLQTELAAALTAAAVFDLGYRTRVRITGSDRLRWLNGMVSNAIQTLPEGFGNYNFILNAQGRIQGDAYIYRTLDSLVLDTDRSQAARLLAHLDHFIIMDDVELHPLDDAATGNATSSIGLAGPLAAAILEKLGLNPSSLNPLQFVETTLAGAPVTLIRAYSVLVPRYELWFDAQNTAAVWKSFTEAGAQPIGIEAVEALRILDGTPRYGIDITDRHLPQETSQVRALNFTKGCYLGQEIVERIRSRATVHRNLRQFSLTGSTPVAPIELHAEADSAAIGQLTSIAEIRLPNFAQTLAIGSIRTEAVERKARLQYDEGTATVLDQPPALS